MKEKKSNNHLINNYSQILVKSDGKTGGKPKRAEDNADVYVDDNNPISTAGIGKIFATALKLLSSFAIFILFWHSITFIPLFSRLPQPIEVISKFIFLWNTGLNNVLLWQHLIASFIRVIIGFGYSALIAVPLGVFLGLNNKISQIINPIIDLLRPIPPIAWIPFSILIFGLSPLSYTFVIFVGAFFPLFQNTFDAICSVNRVYVDVAYTLGATKSEIIWNVTMPSIFPNIITGSKISMGVGWMCVIAAEMIGISSNQGIGLFIIEMQNVGDMAAMLAGMGAIGLGGLIISSVFMLIEKYALNWMK